MDEEEAIQLLKEFRWRIDQYLFLGYSPPNTLFGGEGSKEMSKALKDPKFEHLRDVIADMEPKVLNILEECGFNRYITLPTYGYDAPEVTLFELVWRNYTACSINKEFFFEKIDRAIKILQRRNAGEVILVVSGSTEWSEALKLVAEERQLTVKSTEPDMKNEEILELIELSEVVIVDLTVQNPNLFFEAGYAQGVGNSLIYMAKEGTEIDFDFTEYPVIYFETKYDLRWKVYERLDMLEREKETASDKNKKIETDILRFIHKDM